MENIRKLQTVFLLTWLILHTGTGFSQPYTRDETIQLLNTLSAKLNSINSVSYKYSREAVYTGENYHNIYNTDVYMDLSDTDGKGYHFQATNDKYFSCYNGSQYFALDKAKKTIVIKQRPGADIFESLSPLYNSLISLRAVFPMLIKSDAVKKVLTDTMISHESFYRLQFELYDQYLGNLGDLKKFTPEYTGDRTKPYEIVINKKTLLPYLYITKFRDRREDLIAARFTDIDTNAKKPDELSWFYSTYTTVYEAPKAEKPLVSLSAVPENWVLPSYTPGKTDTVSLYRYRGKIVLLDFWIKTCGPCLASFPHLDEMQKKFGADKFQLLSINTEDSKEDIAFFYKKHKPVYKMLFGGQRLVEEYGIPAFPTCIVLDKGGKVIYAGGFDKAALEKIIKANL